MMASPSNPTGTSIPFAELTAICDLARSRDAWRIVDEIYLDLADPAADGTPPRSALSIDPDAIVVALALPIRRATRGTLAAPVNPFWALRIAILAKASSIVGAGLAVAGLLVFVAGLRFARRAR